MMAFKNLSRGARQQLLMNHPRTAMAACTMNQNGQS